MNPEKRFGQIEEVLTDVVIKVDRIVDGQGKILDEVTKQRTEIDALKVSSESTARGLANLTIENQQAHQQMNEKLDFLIGDIGQVKETQQQILGLLNKLTNG